VQHVPDISDDDHGGSAGGFARTDVEITAGTVVRDVLGAVGDRLSVHCHHHQVLDRVADGLVVSARAGDGLIEAVELPAAPFVVGVQWHPEQHEADRRLFRALATAASSALVPSAGRGAGEAGSETGATDRRADA
jgi:gamma-glutamyl-gamma-aminobutyrate hydrolase PuuD